MNLSVGIVGLPNVGKSTLFNALLKKQQALAANYPFATIEPNVGIVAVPDSRLEKLAEITKEEEKMSDLPPLKPATVEFVDIAGLVKGASEGAGLGNKFLSHIREVSVVAHVVRAFTDENVIKEGAVDPKTDYEVINMELMLTDLASVNKALENRKMEPGKKIVLEKVQKSLEQAVPVRSVILTEEEQEQIKDLFMLSNKPELVVLNVSEKDYNPEGIERITKEYKEILKQVQDDNFVVICAQIESELAGLSEDEQKEYLKDLGLEKSGLERLIQKAYQQLGLISFLTCGEKEVRAWTVQKGSSAPQAAGEIHTDFIKKFIKAEVVAFNDFVEQNGWKGSREHGKARLEGKEYVMKDGDVVEFKIGS
ncbi:MAG TPA: redox-regulated ATPase YchF [Candidatus Eisenbacteria bacterium]|nr:redox-regulated ATPase YchF [Candidatus Eisenbacteria bacterium]